MHPRRQLKTLSLLAVGLCLAASSAHAYSTDPLIEGAKQCTRHLPHYEREYGIPTHLLSAIASTESGRYHEGLKLRLPWPWTINVEGKGYFFNSKQEAIDAVRKFQARGAQSIDVGCMQVNLYHHRNAFSSLEQAFEPDSNIAYAASFLRSLYQERNSWKLAAADYHSKTPSRGNQYVGVVYNSWYQIIDKLRMAQMQIPASTLNAMNEPINVATAQPAKPVALLSEQKGKKIAQHQTPHMKIIQVNGRDYKDTSKEHGIIVVRPEIRVVDEPKITVAQVKPASAKEVVPAEPKVLHVNSPQPQAGRSGPNFIFND